MAPTIQEFRDFIFRGNVVDLAVGIVIGAAFTAIVNSLVADVLTPIIGILFSAGFSTLSVTINDSTITYGNFLNALISFVLVAAALFFFVVKPMNVLERRRRPPGLRSRPRRPAPSARPRSRSPPAVARCTPRSSAEGCLAWRSAASSSTPEALGKVH